VSLASAGERDGELEITLAAGYDSNALELPDGEDGGVFTDVGLSGDFAIAEGVDSESSWRLLRYLKCDLGQGF
jgi:hypothetical protein